jgi:hypothetical protein
MARLARSEDPTRSRASDRGLMSQREEKDVHDRNDMVALHQARETRMAPTRDTKGREDES